MLKSILHYVLLTPTHRYDLVDIGRNSLQMLAIKYYTEMVTAYNDNNTDMLM